jgi:3-phenylpropionate/trans-cinnamate dioxygenase ferredoxin reductase subunit
MSQEAIVVVGGGHAAAQICATLCELGQGSRVHLVCEEPVLPYQRPPLSKGFFKKEDESIQLIRAKTWYEQNGITLHVGDPAISVDVQSKGVLLASKTRLAYGQLVLATGTRPRRLPDLPQGLENVHLLRTAQDAEELRQKLSQTQRFAFIGGGFIGLELAATLSALGKEVTVLEVGQRLLARSISPQLSKHVYETHVQAGQDIQLQAQITGYEMTSERVTKIKLSSGELAVDRVLVGIGAFPETTLAQSMGLLCEGGIVVDDHMRCSLPDIWAIGDCTSFPYGGEGKMLRLESIQNANDQAKIAAQSMLGQEVSYRPTPWFWSEQGAMRLQMVGLMPTSPTSVKRTGANEQSFSLFHYDGEQLACVESVNAVMDHMMAKKFFELGVNPKAHEVSDPQVALKSLVA